MKQSTNLFTIGFTKKTAQEFFTLLSEAGVKRIIDTRLNNVSQLAGFAKRKDLEYFLKEIANLDNKGEDFGFESENLTILPGQWQKVGQVSPNEVIQYCDNSFYILHNRIKYVEVSFLESLALSQRKTIQLVYTSSLSVVKDNNQWKGSLVNNSNQKLDNIKITDVEFMSKLESGYQPQNPCLVTVSLSMPWSPPNWEGDTPCWKLIAGVIELS